MDRRTFLVSSAIASLHQSLSPLLDRVAEQGPAESAALREKLMHDTFRPQYHLLPQAGFLGDPCAPRFYNGQNHAFFHGSFGGRGWHHAISHDLVHWQHMPIALAPTDGSYDSYGTFTGSVLPSAQDASVVYTGTTKVRAEDETIRHEEIREVQCIATSNDPQLRTWQKLPAPVIDHPPEGMKVTGFRDPFSWKEDGTWYMGIGSGLSGIGGLVLLYRSVDARRWEYLHPLAQGTWNGEASSNPVPSGEMWECPDLFPLGSKHVLLYSTERKTMWHVGTFDRTELRFHSERSGLLDHGAYYAPKSMLDRKGRRILWGWVQETRPHEEITSAGWAGCMSLPRVLTVGVDNELCMQVAPELDVLLKNTVEISGPQSSDELLQRLEQIAIPGRAAHLRFSFEVGGKAFGLRLQIGDAEGGPALLTIAYPGNAHGYAALALGDKSLLLSPDTNRRSEVLAWIDGSVLELFVDRKHAMTLRSYVDPSNSGPIRVKWSGAPEPLLSLNLSEVIPISSDRLTS